MRRVAVVGNSGSGKTTVGRALAEALDVPFLELDSLFHQPGWTALPTDQFREQVAAVVAGDGWVVDGNYAAVRDVVWARADTVVWVDPPLRRVVRQLLRRTLRRGLTREQLWNGNRESVRNILRADPDLNIVLWALRNHRPVRRRYAALTGDPQWSRLTFVRVRTRRGGDGLVDLVRVSARRAGR